MVSAVVCCSELLAVAGWLIAALATARVEGRPESATGRPSVAWHVSGEGRGTPAFRHDIVFFLSRRHELVAIDARTGQVRWRRPTRGPGETTAGSSVVATTHAIVAGDGDLVAFSSGGLERWRFTPADGSLVGVYLGEATDHLVFAGSPAGRLWAIETSSGRPRWSVQPTRDDHTVVYAPVVSGDLVAAGFTSYGDRPAGGVVAIDHAAGLIRWTSRFPLPHPRVAGTAFAGGPVFCDRLVLAASQDGAIHAFDRRSGALVWSIPRAAGPALGGTYEFRALAHTGGTLVAASLTGSVSAYDLITRRERWRRRPVGASVMFGLGTDRTTVYVPYLSGHLVAVDLGDGRERWRTAEPAFSWKPLVAAGRVFAASTSAGFFAFHQ